ncbi:hypothetical protein HYT24_00265 [Candidatus Pacearchaeota archaeon]|nr:hypothetical protein [Candidatus Pacearchaeota archaeon]
MNSGQKRLSLIFIVILTVVLVTLSAFLWVNYKNGHSQIQAPQNSQNIFEPKNECRGNGTVNLSSPMKMEDIGIVIPMGLVVGDHVTPIDHMYLQPTIFHSQPDTYNVYADADGVITGIGVEPENPENKYKKINVRIMHTCDFYSIYNLLTSLSIDIVSVTGEMSYGDYWSGSIPVKKGQIIGKIGGQTLDLSVNYDKIILKGFIVPEHYDGESWKIHTVDPFDYFEEPYRSQLLEKNLRTALPLGGKIDYDIDGRLVGNWFVEGSGGYPEQYVPEVWRNHLSFVYDYIDPTHIIVSMGNYGDDAKQAAVKGNFPDPKDVSVSTGIVKYELVGIDYILENGQSWDRMSVAKNLKVRDSGFVEGTVLAQMTSDRKIKFEAFPGKTADQVSGFTEEAVIYER